MENTPDSGTVPGPAPHAHVHAVSFETPVSESGAPLSAVLTPPLTLQIGSSQTGYIQRRLNKSMEDHTVKHGLISDASGDIISFRWGGDGMNLVSRNPQDIKSFFPQPIVEGILNSRRRVSDRPSWILISKTPARKSKKIIVIIVFFYRASI